MTDAATSIVNAMSVDVEDYFQVSAFDDVVARDRWDSYQSRVVANTERLLSLFHEHGVLATFFTLGWVAERHPDLVRRIVDAGHELASHGYGHRLIYSQRRDEFRDDVRRAKRLLEDIAGQPVHGYRAPSYSVTRASLWALDVLVDEGYRYDASIFPVHHDRYGIPDAPRHCHTRALARGRIVEVPPSTVRLLGTNLPVAGGDFRLLPFWWTAWGIRRVNRSEGRPAVFYLHPWEIDPDQPRLPAGRLSTFRHYRNLARTEGRLRRLCGAFAFSTVAHLVATRLGEAA